MGINFVTVNYSSLFPQAQPAQHPHHFHDPLPSSPSQRRQRAAAAAEDQVSLGRRRLEGEGEGRGGRALRRPQQEEDRKGVQGRLRQRGL